MPLKTLTFLMIFNFLTPVVYGLDSRAIEKEKRQAVEKLRERKKGFEKYLQRKKRWNERRLSRADEQKQIRENYAEKRERARKNFDRPEDSFPYKAYRKFIKNRERKRKLQEKARIEHAKMSKELDEVFENERYKIDGNKEFDLDLRDDS